MRYLITSKPGMTPWSYADTLEEAERDATEAQQQGLDGGIIPLDEESEVEHARRTR